MPHTASLKEYEDFRGSNMTHKVYESTTQVIAVEEVQVTILDARPQTDIYIDAPTATSKQILGIPYEVAQVEDKIIKVKSEYDTRLVSNMTDDDKELLKFQIDNGELSKDTVTLQHIELRLTFVEKVFTYQFYSFKDFFGDIGGVFGAVKISIGESFGGWIILFFIVDLIYMIIAKHNYEYRISTIKALAPKCQLYADHIAILKTENANDLEKMQELEEDDDFLQHARATIDHQNINDSNILDSFDDASSCDDDDKPEPAEDNGNIKKKKSLKK